MEKYQHMGTKLIQIRIISTYGNIAQYRLTYGNNYREKENMGPFKI